MKYNRTLWVIASFMVPLSIATLFFLVFYNASKGKDNVVNLVNSDELNQLFKDKETFILVLGNKTQCLPCVRYKEGGLTGIVKKYGYKAKFLEIDQVKKQKDMDTLTSILTSKLQIDISKPVATPSTYFIKDGELFSYVEGAMTTKEIETEYNKIFSKAKN